MKKTKKELSDLELTAMLIQYLVEIDEFPDTWKDFETPEERLQLKQEFPGTSAKRKSDIK